MPDNLEIVKNLYNACIIKDFETVKSLLDPNYTLKDPMMQLNSAQELIDMMANCPGGKMENIQFIAQGDKVVGTFDMSTDDDATPLRMCSIVTLENGKIKSEEMFYDTAKIPQDMKDSVKKNAPSGSQKAA